LTYLKGPKLFASWTPYALDEKNFITSPDGLTWTATGFHRRSESLFGGDLVGDLTTAVSGGGKTIVVTDDYIDDQPMILIADDSDLVNNPSGGNAIWNVVTTRPPSLQDPDVSDESVSSITQSTYGQGQFNLYALRGWYLTSTDGDSWSGWQRMGDYTSQNAAGPYGPAFAEYDSGSASFITNGPYISNPRDSATVFFSDDGNNWVVKNLNELTGGDAWTDTQPPKDAAYDPVRARWTIVGDEGHYATATYGRSNRSQKLFWNGDQILTEKDSAIVQDMIDEDHIGTIVDSAYIASRIPATGAVSAAVFVPSSGASSVEMVSAVKKRLGVFTDANFRRVSEGIYRVTMDSNNPYYPDDEWYSVTVTIEADRNYTYGSRGASLIDKSRGSFDVLLERLDTAGQDEDLPSVSIMLIS